MNQQPDRTDPRRIAMRRVITFLAATYAFTWIPMIILIATGADVGAGGSTQLIFGIAASAPSIVAGVLWLCRPHERRPIRRPRWWVIPLGLVVGVAIVAVPALIRHAGDLSTLTGSVSTAVATNGGLLAVIAITLITGPLAEEFGWRGYLQPRLRRLLPVPAAGLVLGVIWSVWHLPLFFLHGTGQQAAGLLSVRGATLLLGLIPFSLVLMVLTERLRGGVVAAIAAHAGFNGADALLPAPGSTGLLLELAVLIVLAAVALIVDRRVGTSAPTIGRSSAPRP